ncbi:MAG TPA: hypothetical protein VMU50_05345, partial [Polyangia bacterium]|nr:hypothetical protein [Polyangia bacterium]
MSRQRASSHYLIAIAGTLAVAGLFSAAAGCGSSRPGDASDRGTASLDLQIASGIILDQAGFTITGPSGFTKSGTVDLSHSASLMLNIGGLPAGTGYALALTATSVSGNATCGGSAMFDVTAGQTTPVAVHLQCVEKPRAGGIAVSGDANVCPVVDGLSALPARVLVGGAITLAASAHDSDGGPSPLAYAWTATAGSLDDPNAPSPHLTCSAAGPMTVSVAVSDGDCTGTGTLTVVCDSPDCDDDNPCTSDSATPDGACVHAPVA